MLPLAQRHGVHLLPAGECSPGRAVFKRGVGGCRIELLPSSGVCSPTLVHMQHGPHAWCVQHDPLVRAA